MSWQPMVMLDRVMRHIYQAAPGVFFISKVDTEMAS
jgi:hypothetical protein